MAGSADEGVGWRVGGLRLFAATWLALVALYALLRLALGARLDLWDHPAVLVRVMATGALLDAGVCTVLLAPFGAWLALGGEGLLRRARLRFVVLAALFSAAVFETFVEYFFFEEFDARFNHLALDYLVAPHEVGGNIWQSYPVPLYVAAALGVGAAIAHAIVRSLPMTPGAPPAWPARALGAAAALGAGALATAGLCFAPRAELGDREAEQVAANGAVELVSAVQTASLPYADYYHTLPEREMWWRAEAEFGWDDPARPVRTFRAVERRAQPLDVVVVLGESFGSEFVGRLGGDRPCAPGLERWAAEGLLLTNLMATGNRTVRGLEGVLCSFVPLPGDSIWKRDKSEDVATLAGVLRERGYRTEFVYGGAGTFDDMRAFALENGWQRFFEDGLVGESSFSDDAFRTVWGVADEHVFEVLLERQREAARAGERFFGTALTVSNHRPYLTPDQRGAALRGDKLAASARWGVVLLFCSALVWRLSAGAWSSPRRSALIGLVWTGFLLNAWTEAQPRGTRVDAVRYADRALADYLDRARAEGLLDHTVVLFVGDHGARVYGAEEIPAQSYRIPALFLAPGARYRGATIERLCSQIDLAPTLLSLAGIDHTSPFLGEDLLALPPDGPGRAFMIHNRDVGLLTDQVLTVLGLRGALSFYRRSDRASDEFEAVPDGASSPELCEVADRAAAVFQASAALYDSRRYRLWDER